MIGTVTLIAQELFFFPPRTLADSSFKISLVHIKQIKNWLLVLN